MIKKSEEMKPFAEFLDIIETLRSPDGCPWDREQTAQSLRGDLLEESYEAVEAIDENDSDHLREELGDVLLIIGLISQIKSEERKFNFSDVLNEVNAKLIRRHPHVFGNEKVKNADEVLATWERVKIDIEGRAPKDSALDGIPGSFPPLERSYKLQKRAAKKGFDWNDYQGPKDKIFEELDEIKEVQSLESNDLVRLEEEVGDLIFSVVNFARHLGVDPALALSRTNSKFDCRFREVENRMKEEGLAMDKSNMKVMDSFWEDTKK